MKWLVDYTRRFARYPFYEGGELDAESESLVTEFLVSRYGTVSFPLRTDDLMLLIEQFAEDLDWNADLSRFGTDVEGITKFKLVGKPSVEISRNLAVKEMSNRFRMTLAHELAHIRLHSCLYQLPDEQPLFESGTPYKPLHCKRQAIAGSAQNDWMEWQAAYAGGAMLMPARTVRALVAPLIPGGIPAVHPDAEDAVRIGAVVCDRFEVSRAAAHVRLEQLRLFDRNSPLKL